MLSFQDNDQKPSPTVTTLLQVSNVEISEDKPAIFNFPFKKDERFTLSLRKGGGSKAELSDLKIQLKSLAGGKLFPVKPGEAFQIPAEGEYSLEIRSSKNKSLYAAIGVDLAKARKLEEGQTLDLFKSRSLFVGQKEGTDYGSNHPLFTYSLAKGDKVMVNSASKESGILRFHMVSPEDRILSLGQLLTIEKDGVYSFRFYVETEGADKGLLGFLSKGENGVLLSDLGGRRSLVPPAADVPKKEVAPQVDLNIPVEEEPDPTQTFQEIMNQMMKDNMEMMDKLTTQPSDSTLDMVWQENERLTDPIVLQPLLQVSGDSVLVCEPLANLPMGQPYPQFWAYWIGVGDEAFQFYERLDKRVGQNNFRSYIHFYIKNLENKRVLPFMKPPGFFLDNYKNQLSEGIEYAIVNQENMERFKAGLPYEPLSNGLYGFAGENIRSDYGNGPVPSLDELERNKLFLCVCNRNRMSPVKVYFEFQTFAYLP